MEKLNTIKQIKAQIKEALIEKGQTPGDKFNEYPDLIRNIETGGNVDESSLFKISGISYNSRIVKGEPSSIYDTYPDNYYTKFVSNGFTQNNTKIASPKQPLLDLVYLPKIKINGEDWIEKRGYGIYAGDPQYERGINRVELYFKEDPIDNLIFFGTHLYEVEDLNSILNTKDEKYPTIPDNFFRGCPYLNSINNLYSTFSQYWSLGKYCFADSEIDLNNLYKIGTIISLEEGSFYGCNIRGSFMMNEYEQLSSCDIFRNNVFGHLRGDNGIIIRLPDSTTALHSGWNEGSPEDMITLILGTDIVSIGDTTSPGFFVVPDQKIEEYRYTTNWNTYFQNNKLITLSQYESGEYLLTSLELDELEELDYVYASEGKVWKRKSDGMEMSEKICLGEGDSIENYEEVDKPLRDTGVIHGDFSYQGSIIEDEELLNE